MSVAAIAEHLGFAGLLAGPAALWIAYFYRFKDCCRPEPLRAVLGAFVSGVVAAWGGVQGYVLLARLGLPSDPVPLLDTSSPEFVWFALGVIGPLEELAKFLPFVALLAFRRPYINDATDGIVYSSAIALGFASYENVFYLSELSGVERLARALASPLVHTLFASIWGHVTATAYLAGRRWVLHGIGAWAIAALAHGLFDVATLRPDIRLGAAVLALALWLWRKRVAARHHAAPGDRH